MLLKKYFINYLIVGIALVPQLSIAADNTRQGVELAGDRIQILLPAIGAISTLLYEDPRQTHFEGSLQWIKAFIAFEAVTESLKKISHKQRPNGQSFKSFPSGHTAAAFMGATFIHQRYGVRYAIPAYMGAVFVGYSRIYAKKHYGEDVMAGAVIGMASSAIFTTTYKGVVIAPMLAPNTLGVSVSTEW